MISELREMTLDEINAKIREINSEIRRIQANSNQMILPTEPNNPQDRQMCSPGREAWVSGAPFFI